MSRTVAKIIEGVAGMATCTMNDRQKGKTYARVAEEMARRGVQEVQTKHGPLTFYAGRSASVASAIARFHDDEPETIGWIDMHIQPGETLWDIGANIGIYSLYAGKRGAKVIAFEPSALNLGLLAEHIHLNGLDKNISPVCVALGRDTKMDTLFLGEFSQGAAGNGLGSAENQFGAIATSFAQGIPAFRGEDFCRVMGAPAPDHIKLDVDGIEAQILDGLAGLLPNIKSITVEVEGRNAADAEAIITPILKAGLVEDESHRTRGSMRNRLYINPKR